MNPERPWTARVLTIGTFDLLHPGHIRFIRACQLLGAVTVGINSDAYAEQSKRRPVMSEREREECVAALRVETFIYSGPAHFEAQASGFDFLVVGSDWADKDYLAHLGTTADHLRDTCLQLVYLPRTPGISTKEIIVRCWNSMIDAAEEDVRAGRTISGEELRARRDA